MKIRKLPNDFCFPILKPLLAIGFIHLYFICCTNNCSFAQELTIGVPLTEQPINFVESSHPFSQLIYHATTQTLLGRKEQNGLHAKLVLADSFSNAVDGKSMDIRLRAGTLFTNSESINETDLNASLNRCVSKPNLNFLSRFKILPTFKVYTREKRIFVSLQSSEGLDSIVWFVGNCPILEERSLRLFGNDLGNANLVLGTGPYQLTSRVKNREARLERIAKQDAWASVLTIRGFADPIHALTALRTGTIDAFYTQNAETEEKAKNDPTLLMRSCGVYNIILRKGLEFDCLPFSDPGSFRYSETT